MKKNIFITCLAWLFLSVSAFAHIDVVYPKVSEVTVNASSVFFLGNTTENADFSINGEKVELWDSNFFVHVIPLKYGKNIIKMVSIKNGVKEQKIYTVTRPKPVYGKGSEKEPYQPKKANYTLYTKTVKENATIREKPSTSAQRVIDIPENVVLYLDGKQGEYYKIDENGETQYWVHKSNVKDPVNVSKRIPALLKRVRTSSDKHYEYIKFSLNYPVLYNLKQEGNSIELTLFGVETTDENGNKKPNYKYTYTQDYPIMGYDASYEDGSLVLRIAKTPEVKDLAYPLKDITIFIDPGHGGVENGAIGPTRTSEKDINLAISRYLMKYLEDEGADVIISRTDDRQIGLYDRVKMAKEHNAYISLSIHNNALPNGKNPYVQHGTEVHYYNENAKLLSEIIQADMVRNLNFKDNGIHKSSFALNRSTNPVSVLIECAYMIHPQEYMRLRNPAVQRQIAQSIKNSLKKYVIVMQK